MTLDTDDMKTDHVNNNMDIGGALKDVLSQAQLDDRLTCGVYESSKMLEMNPDGIMLCVLPENVTDDVTLHIHFTLIEAYCWENNIRVIKVDNSEKLCALLTPLSRPALHTNDTSSPDDLQDSSLAFSAASTDFNCVLLEYPTTQCSELEEDVMEFCKITSDMSPSPTVNIPV